MRRVIGKLKERKAIGRDGVPNEIWKYGGEGMVEWVWRICGRVWRGEGWPEWKEGIIIPIVKKGNGEVVEEYRGVTLMSSFYKIYVSILAERLGIEVEEKRILVENQVGFRKGRGTLDAIYVMNYLVNRQLSRKGGTLVAMLVDLKAAFDSVGREQ